MEGRLNFEQWQDQNNNKRSKHSVIVETMQMLDSKPAPGQVPIHQENISQEHPMYDPDATKQNQYVADHQAQSNQPSMDQTVPEIDVDT